MHIAFAFRAYLWCCVTTSAVLHTAAIQSVRHIGPALYHQPMSTDCDILGLTQAHNALLQIYHNTCAALLTEP